MSNDLSLWLNQQLERVGWSYRELGRRTELPHSSIARYAEGTQIPTPDSCAKIAKALGVPTQEVMRLAGHLPDPGPDVDAVLQELLEVARQLPPGEREEILWYARKRYERYTKER
jgi:transcriptional regulator with XRE-family HTH domain